MTFLVVSLLLQLQIRVRSADVLPAIVVSTAVVAAVAFSAMFIASESRFIANESRRSVASPVRHEPRIVDASLLSLDRVIYKYSVIPGGVRNGQELAEAIESDPVVAGQYGSLNTATMHREVVKTDLWAYVTYRIHDRVYWTGHKVHIRSGETILSDGTTQLRTRCGNCISMEPLLPTSDDEPNPLEFDGLIGDEPPLPSRSLTGLITPFPDSGSPPDDTGAFRTPPFPMGFGGGGGGIPQSQASTTPTGVNETSNGDVPVGDLPVAPPDGGQPPPTDVITAPGAGPGNDAPPESATSPEGTPSPYSATSPDSATSPEGDTPFLNPLKPPLNDDNPPPTGREAPPESVPVPEAGTFMLFGSGAALFLARRWFSKR